MRRARRLPRWRSAPPRAARSRAPAAPRCREASPGGRSPARDRGDARRRQAGHGHRLPAAAQRRRGERAASPRVSDPCERRLREVPQPERLRERFGPSDADVAAVEGFLRGAGLSGHRRAEQQPLRRGDGHARAGRGRLRDERAPLRLQGPAARRSEQRTCRFRVGERQGARGGRARPVGRVHPPAERPAGHHEPGGAAGRAARRRRRAPPPDAFVNAPPCSTYFGEKTATQYPSVNGPEGPVRAVRLHAVAVPGRLRHRRRSSPRASTAAA